MVKIQVASALILATALWGFLPTFIKWLLPYWTPITIVAMRFGCMSIVLFLLFFLANKKKFGTNFSFKKHFFPRQNEIFSLVLMGLCGVLLNNCLQFTGLKETTVTNSTLISALTPTITAFLAAVFLRERLHGLAWFGIFLSFVGILCVVSRGSLEVMMNLQFHKGDIFCILGQTAWAVMSLISVRIVARLTPLGATAWMAWFGFLITAMYGWISGELHVVALDFFPLLSFLYVMLGGGLIALVSWNYGVKCVGPSISSMFLNLMPLVGLLSGFFFFGETIGALQIFGIVTVCLGVYMTTHS